MAPKLSGNPAEQVGFKIMLSDLENRMPNQSETIDVYYPFLLYFLSSKWCFFYTLSCQVLVVLHLLLFFHLLNLPSTPAESGSQVRHCLSQQGVLATFGHPDLQKSSFFLRTKTFCEDLFLNINFRHINEFFHLNIIPMAVYMDKLFYFIL